MKESVIHNVIFVCLYYAFLNRTVFCRKYKHFSWLYDLLMQSLFTFFFFFGECSLSLPKFAFWICFFTSKIVSSAVFKITCWWNITVCLCEWKRHCSIVFFYKLFRRNSRLTWSWIKWDMALEMTFFILLSLLESYYFCIIGFMKPCFHIQQLPA